MITHIDTKDASDNPDVVYVVGRLLYYLDNEPRGFNGGDWATLNQVVRLLKSGGMPPSLLVNSMR